MTGQQKALMLGGLLLAGFFFTRKASAGTLDATQAASAMPALGSAPPPGSSGLDAVFGRLLDAVAPATQPAAPSQSVSSSGVANLATMGGMAPSPAASQGGGLVGSVAPAPAPAPTSYWDFYGGSGSIVGGGS